MKKRVFAITLIITIVLLAGCALKSSQLASSITTAVPDVTGLTQNEAESRISDAGFIPEVIYIDSDKVPAGAVVKTDPSAGQAAAPSSIVKLFVSKEGASAAVPDVVGMSLKEATDTLASQGLQVGDIKYKDSDKAKDVVLVCNPLPGVKVPSGSKISFTLSSGEKRERTLNVDVDVPGSNDKIEFTIYIDGKQDESYTRTVDPASTGTVTFKFRGSSGRKAVRIKADGKTYKSYTLDFDKGTVKEMND